MVYGFLVKSIESELTQYLIPVEVGPSLKICPKCEPHFAHKISVLAIPSV